MNHSPAAALMASLLNVPMALVVWTTLFRLWPREQLSLWVGGALVVGLCSALFSLDGHVPQWASADLANALLAPGFGMRIAALRLYLGLTARGRLLALLALGQFALYMLARQITSWLSLDAHIVMLWPHLLGAAWALVFAWHALLVGRRFNSRSGWLLAAAELVFGSALLVRAMAMMLGWIEWSMFSNDWATRAIEVTGFIAAMYTNLGYLGMALDRTNLTARNARESQLSEELLRQAAEQRTAELHQLLAERNQVLHMLAHEIRQPLHNAGGALQAATRALHVSTAAVGPADEALERAQGVLRHVQSVLDNTLAAAQLFATDAAPAKADTDLDMLVQLTLGDLATDQRARVQLDWQTTLRVIELEPGLVRLALRNLLVNAFKHGGAKVQVRLLVAEQAQPPALLLQVLDDGPALAADKLQRLQASLSTPVAKGNTLTRTASLALASVDTAGRGLGLALARRVMQLYGGELRIAPAPLDGLQASLVFPLPGE